MSDTDREIIVRRYTERFERHGVDVRSLASGTEERHRLQHEVHASAGDLNGKTILDIGCGLAHYYEFLRARGTAVDYIGYDIVPAFIESNRARYPEARFEIRDAMTEGIAHEADFVVMCEVVNNRYRDASNLDVVKKVLTRAFDAAREAVTIDMVSTYVDYQVPEAYYFSPEEMFAFAKSLTKYVTLRHDYVPFHFTLMLYRR